MICGLLQQSVYVKNSEEFYNHLLESAIECIEPATKGSIMLMDDNNKLYFAAAIGYDYEILKHTYLDLEQTYLYRESKGMVNKTVKILNPFEYDRNSFNVKNIDDILKAGTENVMTTLSTPIFFEGKLHGMINIESPMVNAYDQYDMDIIEMFAIEAANVLKLYNSLKQIYYMTNYDMLTNIPNRRFITESLEQIHGKYLLNGGTYALISIDLNNLKTTNDRYGHLAGDELLKTFASIFRKKVPSDGIFGRNGGDEFLLVLPDTEKEAAQLFMEEVKKLFKKVPLLYESESIEISFCYGIAVFGPDGSDLQELFHLSDCLMYEQKKEFHDKKIL
jgi:diguanylate cyclase (GGDEF)-like protein